MSYSVADIQAFIASVYGDPRTGQVSALNVLPYAYPVTFAALAQGQSPILSFQIQANADFILLAVKHRAQIGVAQTYSTVTAPFVRLLLTDTGSSRQLTNAAVDLVNYSTGEDGCYRPLPYPYVLNGRSSVNVQATNYSPGAGETYTTLDLLFEGVQVYKY